MKPRSAAIVAVRVIALWMGIETLTMAIGLIIFTVQINQVSGTGFLWAILVARAVIAILLWSQAENLAIAIARGTGEDVSEVRGRTANTHAVAFSVVGLILTVNGLTGLVGTAANEASASLQSVFGAGLSFAGSLFGSTRVAAIVVELLMLGIGLLLLFWGGELAAALSRRYPEPDPPVAAPPPA